MSPRALNIAYSRFFWFSSRDVREEMRKRERRRRRRMVENSMLLRKAWRRKSCDIAGSKGERILASLSKISELDVVTKEECIVSLFQ